MWTKLKSKIGRYLPSQDARQNVIFSLSSALFLLYCFSIPTFSSRYPFNYVSIEICALMCVSMAVYVFLYGKFKINIMVGLMILFNICLLITHLMNRSLGDVPKTIILMSVVAFFTYQFLSTYKHKDIFFIVLLLAGLLFSFIYIIHYRSEIFSLSTIFSSRLGTFFDNENEIAKEFGFFCVIALALATRSKKVSIQIVSYILTIFFLFLILTTGSISNLLTAVLVCCVVLIACQKTKKRMIIASIVVFSLVVMAVVAIQLPFMSYFKTRIENIFSTLFDPSKAKSDGSASDRFNGAITSILIGLNRFLFGFGYMSATHFTYNSIQAHNNFAELFIDFGIIGLLIYEALVLLPLLNIRKSKNKEYVLAIALHMFIFQLFLTTYYKKFEYLFFALIFASMEEAFETEFVLFNSSRLRKHKPTLFEIIPSLTPIGGAETFVVDFVKSFKEKYGEQFDLKLIILYKQEESRLLAELRKSKIDFIILDKKKGLDLKAAFKLRDLILEYNPEIIHTHLFSISILKIALPFKQKRIKCFHTIHHNFSGDNKSHKLLKHLVKKNYLTPICVAKKPAVEYEQYFGKKPIFINNGIDLYRYDSSKPLSQRKYDILVAGRFVAVKNQRYLLQLIYEEPILQKYKIVFLGDGPLLEDCKEFAKDNSIDKNIKFEGFSDDVAQYMSDSKLLVMPSLNEGNPIVINEAFASGMAVIGNKVGGIVDLLSKVQIGGTEDIKERKQFALLIDKTLKKVSGGKCDHIDYDSKKFDINVTVDSYYKLFTRNDA